MINQILILQALLISYKIKISNCRFLNKKFLFVKRLDKLVRTSVHRYSIYGALVHNMVVIHRDKCSTPPSINVSKIIIL